MHAVGERRCIDEAETYRIVGVRVAGEERLDVRSRMVVVRGSLQHRIDVHLHRRSIVWNEAS